MNTSDFSQAPQSNPVKEPAIYSLTGKELEGGWIVGRLLSKPLEPKKYGFSGGAFSVCYECERDGILAFLKVFDVFQALSDSKNFTQEMQKLTQAYDHEVFLLKLCERAGLTRVVKGIEAKADVLQEPLMGNFSLPFLYVIFEAADQGDLRKMLHYSGDIGLAAKFKLLHEVAIGLRQLHQQEIAHQDLKPSNVGVFSRGVTGAKILDLGRATSNKHPGIYDGLFCAGDMTYASPEQLYGYDAGSFTERRAGGDLFQMGSLLSFMLLGRNANEQIFSRLDRTLHPRNWNGVYMDILPHIQQAFADWLDEIADDIPSWCREEVSTILRTACEPDPHRRGDPKARCIVPSRLGPNLGMDRYVTRLDRLHIKARLHARAQGAK